MKRRDIYRVALDPSEGHEQKGTQLTRVPIVVPTTGGNFARTAGFAVALQGTRTTGVARCDQPRPIDLEARRARRLESVQPGILNEVLARIAPLFA